jgi:hypothetical protein
MNENFLSQTQSRGLMISKWNQNNVGWLCSALMYALLATSMCTTVLAATVELKLDSLEIRSRFTREVNRRLNVPYDEQQRYANLLNLALIQHGIEDRSPQYFIVIDRSPLVQAALVYFLSPSTKEPEYIFQFVGASPVSTGRAGSFDHFITPLGVFEHSLENPDFRAEGTVNEFGIRGYGAKGMRIFDFGWVLAERGWGEGGMSIMRLQMHATDPKLLEPLLGEVHSKGCIRIPAALNTFIDRYGLLDFHYLSNPDKATVRWLLRSDRTPVLWPGRYLVVIESSRETRPSWAIKLRQKIALAQNLGSCAFLP